MAYQDPGTGSGQDGSTTEVAKEQAGRVGQTAVQAGGEVAQTTKDQVQNVVGEAKQQARDLVGEARGQVRDQAGTQKSRAVGGLRALGDELEQMAQGGGSSGIATEVARQVSGRTRELADYLDRHEPADLLENVRSYARRRPVAFLAGAALAGALAGRLTKGLQAGTEDRTGQLPAGQSPALPSYQGTYQQTPYEGAGTGYAGTGYAGTGYESGTGYQTGGTEQPGYQPGYEPATVQGGGFRAPDAPPVSGYQGADRPNGGQQGEYDPGYDPQQPPARGWTP